MGFVVPPLLAGQIALAQTSQPQPAPAVEDFKPASSNQGGRSIPRSIPSAAPASESSRPRPSPCGCPSGAGSP